MIIFVKCLLGYIKITCIINLVNTSLILRKLSFLASLLRQEVFRQTLTGFIVLRNSLSLNCFITFKCSLDLLIFIISLFIITFK